MEKPLIYKGAAATESDSPLSKALTDISKSKAIRKSLPRHLGRRTKAERDALIAQRSIHTPRNLRKMLLQSNLDSNLFGNNDAFVDSLLVTFRHWLMDCSHDRRMRSEIDEQDTIERLIEAMGEKE